MKIGAVAAKEFWGLLRQPQLLLLLLIGPVLVMVVFGLSLSLDNILWPRVVVVAEPGSEGDELFERFREEFTDRLYVVGKTDDPEEARERLLRGGADAMVAIPPDPLERVERGEQATLDVTYNTINPVFGTAVPERTYSLVSGLNQSVVQATIERNIGDVRSAQEQIGELNRQFDEDTDQAARSLASEEAQATTTGLDESLASLENSLRLLQAVSPGEEGNVSDALEQVEEAQSAVAEVREAQEAGSQEIQERSGVQELEQRLSSLQETLAGLPTGASPRVLANPFRLELDNLASPPSLAGFYAPGLLALLIQHMAVSLASLSLIRERLSGAYEFFEVSPLGPGELLAGKFLTYFGLVLGANLTVAAALVYLLGIPLEGGALIAALAMAMVTVASLGLGFLVSALAKSQLQAVQVSMLLLIGSVLFAGFLFPLSDLVGPAVVIAYFLPASYGIRSLQDIMIRGEDISHFDLTGLFIIAAVCLVLTRYLMGRKKT